MGMQEASLIWSLIVLVWGVAVLVLLGRCSYYLKHTLNAIKAIPKAESR